MTIFKGGGKIWLTYSSMCKVELKTWCKINKYTFINATYASPKNLGLTFNN